MKGSEIPFTVGRCNAMECDAVMSQRVSGFMAKSSKRLEARDEKLEMWRNVMLVSCGHDWCR